MALDDLVRDLRRNPTCSVENAARVLGIGRGTAYEAARSGTLPGVLRLGRRFVVAVPTLLKALGYNVEEPEDSS